MVGKFLFLDDPVFLLQNISKARKDRKETQDQLEIVLPLKLPIGTQMVSLPRRKKEYVEEAMEKGVK